MPEKMLKTVSKSVRMTEEVYGYVMETPGKGFAEKFENMVLTAYKRIPELNEKIGRLEKELEVKRLDLYHMMDANRDLDSFFRMYRGMYGQLEQMRLRLDSVSACIPEDMEGEKE